MHYSFCLNVRHRCARLSSRIRYPADFMLPYGAVMLREADSTRIGMSRATLPAGNRHGLYLLYRR